VRCVSGRFGWHITAQYSSELELATNPVNDPAKITVSTEQFQRPIIADRLGQSVCNSAGDPFDPAGQCKGRCPAFTDEARCQAAASACCEAAREGSLGSRRTHGRE
jgi:hypothetical protein